MPSQNPALDALSPVGRLINTRIAELGLRRSDLARRLGYQNVNGAMKALDRAERLFDIQPLIRANLATALEVAPEVAATAIRATEDAVRRQRLGREAVKRVESARRYPMLRALPDRERPRSITCAAAAGDSALRVLEVRLAEDFADLDPAHQQRLIDATLAEFEANRRNLAEGFWGPINRFQVLLDADCPPERTITRVGPAQSSLH